MGDRYHALSVLVGVQSNQYPRSLHIAKPLREAGIPVIIGGFHVSGIDKIGPDLQAALDMGITLFAGEAEGRIDEVFCAMPPKTRSSHLQLHNDLPPLEHAVIPFLPGNHQRITAQMASARSELWRRSGQRRVPKGQRRFPDAALPRP
jgi:hypothetical protein